MAAGATSRASSVITTSSVAHVTSSSSSSATKPKTLGLVASVHHTTSTAAPVQTTPVNTPAEHAVTTAKAAQNTPTVQKTSAPQNKPAPSPSPAPAPAPAPASQSNGGTSSADIQAYLAGHNTIRAQHGASPLTWNDNLASKAQQWANNCKFQHSGGSLGPFGGLFAFYQSRTQILIEGLVCRELGCWNWFGLWHCSCHQVLD